MNADLKIVQALKAVAEYKLARLNALKLIEEAFPVRSIVEWNDELFSDDGPGLVRGEVIAYSNHDAAAPALQVFAPNCNWLQTIPINNVRLIERPA